MKAKAKFGLLIALFLLTSCSLGTVKPFIKDISFQEENLPIRDLRIAVLFDFSVNQQKLKSKLNEVSNLLVQQVGIRLEIVRWLPIRYQHFRADYRVNQIMKLLGNDCSFDLAIGFGEYTILGKLQINTIGGGVGVIEDTYRKFIAIKLINKFVILHEIFHAFIFEHDHGEGVMSAMLFKIIPFAPGINETPYLTPEDRKEVLKNKWRGFCN